MKKTIILALAIFITSTGIFAQSKAGKEDTTTHISLYSCPMHPGIVTDKAGKCPVCKMNLNRSPKEVLKSQVVKVYMCPVHADEVSDKPGKCPNCGTQMNLSLKEKMKAEATGLYTCPMHPDVSSDKEGDCPKCGMKLVKKS